MWKQPHSYTFLFSPLQDRLDECSSDRARLRHFTLVTLQHGEVQQVEETWVEVQGDRVLPALSHDWLRTDDRGRWIKRAFSNDYSLVPRVEAAYSVVTNM